MEYRVLGPVEVLRDGTAIRLPGGRQGRLLVALLARAGTVVSVDTLTDLVWDTEPPKDPRNALQTTVARLRSTLGPEAGLRTNGPGYLLEPAALDARQFDTLLDASRGPAGADPQRRRALLEDALSLWRGPAYAGFEDGPARAEALRLGERRLLALEEYAAVRLEVGEEAALVGELAALRAAHPLRERLVVLEVRALAACERTADAVAVYRGYRDRLVEETGLEPGPSLQRTVDRLLQQPSRPDADAGSQPREATSPPAHPGPGGDLIGREDDLAALREALRAAPLVTIAGPGGVGKTRLAREATARPVDGAVWVDLTPLTDRTVVDHVVAGALGIDLGSGPTTRNTLLAAIGVRPALLVLDNCEHLIDEVAGLASDLLTHCPAVRVLATSREPLRVPGEYVRPLGPLPTSRADHDESPAVRLFLARAHTAGSPAFSPRDLDVVRELCQELDGLPLAIELAAARSPGLPVQDLLAGLRAEVGEVVGSLRGSARHRDLWSVVDWSYRLLDEQDQGLFEAVSVFSGDFGADQVVALLELEGTDRHRTGARLGGLAERSLLTVDAAQPGRYRLLRPVRLYARQRLADSDQAEALTARHTVVSVGAARRAAGPPLTADGQHHLARLLDDLRSVRRRAMATEDVATVAELVACTYWFDYWRPGTELLGWAEPVLSLPGASEVPQAPTLFAAAATAAWMRGDLADANRLAAAGTALRGPDEPSSRLAFGALADVAFFTGDLAAARSAFATSAHLARRVGDADAEASGWAGLALATAYDGQMERAAAAADAAARCAGRAGPAMRSFVRYVQGETISEVDPVGAVHVLEEAIAMARAAGAWFVEGVSMVTAASLHARGPEPVAATGLYTALLGHWQRSGNWTQQWTTLRNVAELLGRLGDHETALTILTAADTTPRAAPTFGAESIRGRRVREAAEAALPVAIASRARARARELADHQVVALAETALRHLGAPSAVHTPTVPAGSAPHGGDGRW